VPIDFASNAPASVTLQEPGSIDAIKFTAADESCRWNDYLVRLKAKTRDSGAPRAPNEAKQIATFVTTTGLGCWVPDPVTEWPPVYLYDYLEGLLSGQKLQARVRFFATSGGTSVGAFSVVMDGIGLCSPGQPGPILGAYDSGFFDISCVDCTIATDPLIALQVCFNNFSPVVGVVQITEGILDIQWVPDTGPSSDYEPFEPFAIVFIPPCADDSAKTLHFANDGSTDSPPTSAWENSVIIGDAGMEGATDYGAVAVGGGHGTIWWAHQEFPADQFVQVTAFPAPIDPDAVYLFLRLTNPGTANVCGYVMKGTSASAEVYRIDNGVLTLLDTFTLDPPMLTGAFMYRFFASGTNFGVNANIDTADSGFGADLPLIGTTSDATYNHQGFVGVGIDGSDGVIAEVSAGHCPTCPPPGLTVILDVDSCGNITTTYQDINLAVTAADIGITTTVLGGHGSDIVTPTQGVMAGAICTGSVDV